jgi:hypothetical protein
MCSLAISGATGYIIDSSGSLQIVFDMHAYPEIIGLHCPAKAHVGWRPLEECVTVATSRLW